MITHLEPDILECEVKWTLGSITTNKVSGGDGVPVELFQILKDHLELDYLPFRGLPPILKKKKNKSVNRLKLDISLEVGQPC